MKKLLLLLLLSTTINAANAQWVLLPKGIASVADTSKTYVVLDFPGIAQEDLINKTRSFIVQYYASAKNVLSDANTDIVSVKAVAGVALANDKDFYDMEYIITIAAKDARLKVQSTIWSIKWPRSNLAPPMLISWHNVEKMRMSSYIYDKNDKLKRPEMKQNIDNVFNRFTNELVKYVNGKNEDW